MGYLVLNKANGSNVLLAGTHPFIQVTKAEQKQELLGSETFSITIESKNAISFDLGDSVVAFGRRYWYNAPQNLVISETGEKITYSLTMEGVQYKFINAVLFDMGVSQYATTTEVVYTANLLEICRLIVACANFNDGADVFTLDEANVPQTARKTLSFSDTNCLAALQNVCSKENFNVLFKFVESEDGTYVLRVGDVIGSDLPYSFKVGQRGGGYEISRSKDSNSGATYTRIFAFGSSENIATNYRGYSPKLRLPVSVPVGFEMPAGLELINDTDKNLNYVQLVGATQHISYVKTYADIKPHRTGVVSSVDGTSIYKFFDTSMDFNINERLESGETRYLLSGQSAKIHFNTGKLAGLEFDATYNNDEKSFVLVGYTDDKSQSFPDPKSTAFRVGAGDEYVILNINMPETYITAAETELLTQACKDLNSSFTPANKFTVKIRELYLKSFESENTVSNFFGIGDFVHVSSPVLGLDNRIQVLSFTRDWLHPYNYTVELSDTITINYITQLIGSVEEIKNVVITNKLDNPARTKRNWRVSEELAKLIDTVRTDMLLVGNPEGQYDTNIQFEYNFGGDSNRVITSSGTLVHSVYVGGAQAGTWNVGAIDATLTDTDIPYFVYIKAATDSDTATIVFSEDKIKVEDVSGYYHFPYCVLSSTIDGGRTATLLKGSTQIVGDAIRTGHIRGNALDIDLNHGTVKGQLQFQTGEDVGEIVAAIEGAAAAAGETAETAGAAAAAAKTIADAITDNLTTIDGGLILTTLIQMLSNGIVSAGMAAKTDTNNVALFAGGTLAQAQSKQSNFGVMHSGDAWLKGIIEAISGKIGNFEIVSGNIVGRDSNGSTRIKLTTSQLPSLSYLGSSITWEELSIKQITTEQSVNGTAGNEENTIYPAISFHCQMVVPISTNVKINSVIPTYYSEVWEGEGASYVSNTGSSVVIKKNNVTVATPSFGTAVALTAGTYDVYFHYSYEIGININSNVNFWFHIYTDNVALYEGSINQTLIGSDGFYSYFTAMDYVYFSATDNIFQLKIGSYGIQVSTSGIKKLSGGNWVAVTW